MESYILATLYRSPWSSSDLSCGTDPLSATLDADLDGGRRAARKRHWSTFGDVVDVVGLDDEHRGLERTSHARAAERHRRDDAQQKTYRPTDSRSK